MQQVENRDVIRLPVRFRKALPRWPFVLGGWRATANKRETRVIEFEVYRQRRRPRLPVPTTPGDGRVS